MQCAACGSLDEFIDTDHCYRCGINVYELQPGGNPYLEHDPATRALALDMLNEQRRADERADWLYDLEHLESSCELPGPNPLLDTNGDPVPSNDDPDSLYRLGI